MKVITNQDRDHLIAAYDRFRDAAFALSEAIEQTGEEFADCANEYPFSESFDEVAARVSEWAYVSIERMRNHPPYDPNGTDEEHPAKCWICLAPAKRTSEYRPSGYGFKVLCSNGHTTNGMPAETY